MAPVQRYAELVEQMQWLARRIQTFGVHVHVGYVMAARRFRSSTLWPLICRISLR